ALYYFWMSDPILLHGIMDGCKCVCFFFSDHVLFYSLRQNLSLLRSLDLGIICCAAHAADGLNCSITKCAHIIDQIPTGLFVKNRPARHGCTKRYPSFADTPEQIIIRHHLTGMR